ncbi:hypothetical protein GJ496_002417 [Pomphorhynchus laevis]|nr:hypothetical protein GJ496_002417 [Pomphorhynchus laevis]
MNTTNVARNINAQLLMCIKRLPCFCSGISKSIRMLCLQNKRFSSTFEADIFPSELANLGPLDNPHPRYPLPGKVGLFLNSSELKDSNESTRTNKINKIITTGIPSLQSLMYAIEYSMNDWSTAFRNIQMMLTLYSIQNTAVFYPYHPNYVCIEIFSSFYSMVDNPVWCRSTSRYERPEDILKAAKLGLIMKRVLQQSGFDATIRFMSLNGVEFSILPMTDDNQYIGAMFDFDEHLSIKRAINSHVSRASNQRKDLNLNSKETYYLKKSYNNEKCTKRRIVVRVITSAPIGQLSLNISDQECK